MDDRARRARRATALRWILNVHMYGGLLCSSYLVIYGVSSLRYNHPGLWGTSPREVVRWERPIEWPQTDDDLERAEMVRDQLGLFGVVYDVTLAVDEVGNVDFYMFRPLKEYDVTTDRDSGIARVVERRGRLRGIFGALHGSRNVPGSTWMALWGVFTEASWIFMLLSAASGVYLWAVRSTTSVRWGGVLAGALFFAFLSYLVTR